MNRLATSLSLFLFLALALPGLAAVGGIVSGTPGDIRSQTIYVNAGAHLYNVVSAAPAGSTIVVGPGLYSSGSTNLFKNDVNWHFMNGAVVSNAPSAVRPTWDNTGTGNNGAITCSITGDAIFADRSTHSTSQPVGTLFVSNANSQIYFECRAFRVGVCDTFYGAICVRNCGHVTVNVKEVISAAYYDGACGGYTSGTAGIYWDNGELVVNAPAIYCDSAAVIWGGGTTEANCYVNAMQCISSNYNFIYFNPTTPKNKLWVTCLEAIGDGTVGGVGSIVEQTGGKVYLKAQKLSCRIGTGAYAIHQTSGYLWLEADKITTTNKEPFLAQSGGFNWLRVKQWEDLGVGAGSHLRPYNWSVSGGTNVMMGGRAELFTGPGYKVSGGEVHIDDASINTQGFLQASNVCLWITGGTNYIKNSIFISGSLFSVSNASAGDLRVRGTGGLISSSNITATLTVRGGTFIQDSFTDR